MSRNVRCCRAESGTEVADWLSSSGGQSFCLVWGFYIRRPQRRGAGGEGVDKMPNIGRQSVYNPIHPQVLYMEIRVHSLLRLGWPHSVMGKPLDC